MLRNKSLRIQNMPQDSLRSAVYRSFVTCDDPKGVVDCGMIRKSKSGSQKIEQKTENRRKSKNSSTSTSLDIKTGKDEMIPEKFTGQVHNPSCFQLREVSRGAQKLNHMIDSWSSGKRFDGQPKDIAKDLLKGALDLQESLAMLGKLQEASQYMAHLSKKHTEKSKRGRNNRLETHSAYSNHYGDHNSVTEFQKPRLSADGPSRSCTEELKKVIRDSLVKQKLVEDTAFVEKPYTFFPQRYMDSCSGSPSTSSSQSSQSSMFHTTSDSTIASAPPQKAKGCTNLIAKLMGIEEYPLQATLKKQLEGEKISSQQRPMFDIDRPKVRKPQTFAQNVDHERRTLREVLDTMRFKRLLKGNYVQEHKPDFQHSHLSDSEKRFTYDSPPIVLIRPLPDPSLDSEKPHAPLVRSEEAFYTKKMLKKLGRKEEFCPKTIHCKERASKSEKMHRKVEAESKRLNQEARAKSHRVAVGKPEEKEAKTKEKASRMLKASHPADHKPQKKEAIEKKVDRIQKVTAVNRNPPEKDIVKAKNVSKSQDQDKLTSTKARKHESGSKIIKNQTSRQPNTMTNTISKRSTQTLVSNSTERKRNHLRKEKPVKEPIVAKSVTKNVASEESEPIIDMHHKSDASLISSNIAKEEETDTYGSRTEGHYSNSRSSPYGATPLSPEQEADTKTAEETSEHISQSARDGKSFESGENLGDFLLNNPSFLSLAKEFFDLNVNSSTILLTSSSHSYGETGRRLFLDCASELIKCRSVQDSKTIDILLLTCQSKSRICKSLDKLVQEVCNGIENLINYSKLAGENLLADSLYAMLERDILCRGVVNGTWDLGWRNGFSRDEAEQVVDDIEELVLDGLIEEVFA